MKSVKLRVGEAVAEKLKKIIFSRYPDDEWGALFKFGYHEDSELGLLLTLADIIEPGSGDLNEGVGNVQFLEPYLLRAALSSGDDELGLGVIHSHPEDYGVRPSKIDDEMDRYLSGYFGDFAPERPYLSLIWSLGGCGRLRASGRVWWKDRWHPVETTVVGTVLQKHPVGTQVRPVPAMVLRRLERLTGAMGEIAAARLWNSTAVVLGAGGTGSAAAHSLARSCVGRIVLIDWDAISPSNAERVHGCEASHLRAGTRVHKVEILRDLIRRINPDIEVVAIVGNGLQDRVYRELIFADIVLGCTDTNHGRAFLGELSYRYLATALQVNVVLEPKDGRLEGQVVQFTRYRPGRPCAYCRNQVDTAGMAREFMSEEERAARRLQAAEAIARGDRGDPYWRDDPVIPTVGSLTTIAGELAANFAVGMLTERYAPPSDFLELNLLAPELGVTSLDLECAPSCACSTSQGHSDQTKGGRLHLPPAHWPAPRWL
jgi:molybdopterin/thiamine biosynthesis adenylyltransferase